MKKFWKFIAWLIGFLILAAVLAVGSGYLWSFRLNSEPLTFPSMVAVAPQGDLPLDQGMHVSLEFELPLCRKVEKAVLEPGEGCIVAGDVKIERGLWKWSRRVWRIEGELRALRPGEVIPGVLTFEISPAEKGEEPFVETAAVPGFTVLPLQLPPDARPALAGAVDFSGSGRHGTLWWWLLLIPAALLIWYWMRRRSGTERILPPWERALAALRRLGDDVAGGRISLETGFVRLTDLVRNYLEVRFALPASTRTTAEFLDELNDPASPLPPEQRPFLREFLEIADQVKFAKAPPDDAQLRNAMARAGELIASTRVREEDGSSENAAPGTGVKAEREEGVRHV